MITAQEARYIKNNRNCYNLCVYDNNEMDCLWRISKAIEQEARDNKDMLSVWIRFEPEDGEINEIAEKLKYLGYAVRTDNEFGVIEIRW